MRTFSVEIAPLVREDRSAHSERFAWVDTGLAWTDK